MAIMMMIFFPFSDPFSFERVFLSLFLSLLLGRQSQSIGVSAGLSQTSERFFPDKTRESIETFRPVSVGAAGRREERGENGRKTGRKKGDVSRRKKERKRVGVQRRATSSAKSQHTVTEANTTETQATFTRH